MNLIKAAKSDSDAFGSLYTKYSERVFQFIYYRVSSIEDTQDLFSRSWEKIFDKISTLETDEELGFQKWMYAIVRNTIHDHYRASKEKWRELDEEQADEGADPAFAAREMEDHVFLHELMEHLSPLHREIVGLHFFSDLKIKEVAQILAMEENTVSQNLSRALKKLKLWTGKWS